MSRVFAKLSTLQRVKAVFRVFLTSLQKLAQSNIMGVFVLSKVSRPVRATSNFPFAEAVSLKVALR